MKQIKTEVIVVIIALVIFSIVIMAFPVYASECKAESESALYDTGEVYARLTIIINNRYVGHGLYCIECIDREGNIWSFYDDTNSWETGDIANLIMFNIGNRIEEHEVIEVYWEGYTEDIDSFLQLIEWRQ